MRGSVADRASLGTGWPSKSTIRFTLRFLCLSLPPPPGTDDAFLEGNPTSSASGAVGGLDVPSRGTINGDDAVLVGGTCAGGSGARCILSIREGGFPSRTMDFPSWWKRLKHVMRWLSSISVNGLPSIHTSAMLGNVVSLPISALSSIWLKRRSTLSSPINRSRPQIDSRRFPAKLICSTWPSLV